MWLFCKCFHTLGAVIDTALSVTSSVYEVWTHKNSLVEKELTSTGYQVGKEIIGTTVKHVAFCISWREYFIVFLCADTKNIVWKSFSIPDSSFRMLRLCYLVLLPVLLQFQYQLNALSGRSDILIQIKSN